VDRREPHGGTSACLYRENEYWAKQGTDQKNTYYQFKTDYLRLKNMEIGYTFNFPAVRSAGTRICGICKWYEYFTIDNEKVQDPKPMIRVAISTASIWNAGESKTF
jgi:hypothetical protein